MRVSGIATAVLLLTGCAGSYGGYGPAGIPYACADGPARITYEGGGYFPRGTARLDHAGRTVDLAATPPTYGLRYVSEPADETAPIIIWSTRGEEAWVSELHPNEIEEREITRCTRVRAAAGAAADQEDHGGHH